MSSATRLIVEDDEPWMPPGPKSRLPKFRIVQHDSKRSPPVSKDYVSNAQSLDYDGLTSPITSPSFKKRVLDLLSNYLELLSHLGPSDDIPPVPIIPPLTPDDGLTPPGRQHTWLFGYTSPWIDLCSPDPVIQNISNQVFSMEMTYALFCDMKGMIVPGPTLYPSGTTEEKGGIAQYARVIKEVFTESTMDISISIHMPMYATQHPVEVEDSLASYARGRYVSKERQAEEGNCDLFASWDAWNLIRGVCNYNKQLYVALEIPRKLPVPSLQDRWFCEPLELLFLRPSTFLPNKLGYPALSNPHQQLLWKYNKIKSPPFLVLVDMDPIPDVEDEDEEDGAGEDVDMDLDGKDEDDGEGDEDGVGADEVADDEISQDPTPAEASLMSGSTSRTPKIEDPVPHLNYLNHISKKQPQLTILESQAFRMRDYLQNALQPLSYNLEAAHYHVFEEDPTKYDQYEIAIVQALGFWNRTNRPRSGPNSSVVVAVAGAGRGPLVTRVIRAAEAVKIKVEIWAVEKNPNAWAYLHFVNREDIMWHGQVVNIVKSDMRAWKGPAYPHSNESPITSADATYGKVDILISELLGSFGDNELSPECLDGVQHVLSPKGVSIPCSYTAHISPVYAPAMHTVVRQHKSGSMAYNRACVTWLHQFNFLASNVPDHPSVQQTWEFKHPIPKKVWDASQSRKMGGVSGGGGGLMARSDGANDHNSRYSKNTFVCQNRGVVHGLVGYFEAVLWPGDEKKGPPTLGQRVELSILPGPKGLEAKSPDMFSWFPIYFPIKDPLYIPDDSVLEVSMWRQTDDRKVWYEWMVEGFAMVGPNKRVRLGATAIASTREDGMLM